MKNITLITGVSCSGKEETLRNMMRFKTHDYWLSAEAFNIERENYWEKTIAFVKDTIGGNYLIEGFPTWNKQAMEELKKASTRISFIVTYAPDFLLKERQAHQNLNVPISEDNHYFYKDLMETYKNSSFGFIGFINTGKSFEIKTFNSFEEFEKELNEINRLPTRTDITEFISTCPKDQYNDIELPHYKVNGCVPCKMSWKKITEMGVNFKDKTVVDIGCNEGYFLFKAKKAGAKRCIGFDNNKKCIKNGKKIAWLTQTPVDFLLRNVNYQALRIKRDITLCLNMLHYTGGKALFNVFDSTKEAVFEINKEQEKEVEEEASKMKFQLVKKIEGRKNRWILWYKKDLIKDEKVVK